jgi:hypothetical protein
MKMKDLLFKNRIILLLSLFFLQPFLVHAQFTKPLPQSEKFNSIIYFAIGPAFGVGAEKFFEQYQSELDGVKTDFTLTPDFSVGLKFEFLKYFRFGLTGNYFLASFNDYYSQVDSSLVKLRDLTQNIKISTLPIIFSCELVPYQSQFRTFVGLGGGVTIGNIKWEETVASLIPYDKRKSGVHYDATTVSPTFRLYSGVELSFDKKRNEYFIGGLTLELSYTQILRNYEIFKYISRQFDVVPPSFNDTYSFIPYYVSLNIGVFFNFQSKWGKK